MRTWSLFALGLAFGVTGCGGDGGSSDPPPDRRIIEIPDSGNPPDPPDAGPQVQEECDTTDQDCVNPATPKCTIIFSGTTIETECLALTGMVGQDQVCMRAMEGNPGVGYDDCDVGLFCSGLGLAPGMPPPERRCRQFCDVNVNCTTAGQKCASLDGSMGPLQGLCVPTCDLFSTTCDSVAPNMSCSIISNNDNATFQGICRGNGAGGTGSPCMANTDCQPNMNCLSNGTCAALCDTAHACPGGQMCTAVPGLTNMGGFCDPGG